MKIRLNTFETNSSSAHTFVLRSNKDYTEDYEVQDWLDSVTLDNLNVPKGYIPLTSFMGDNDYGREYRLLYQWEDKLSYLVASFKYEETELQAIIEALKMRIPGTLGIVALHSSYDEDEEDEQEVSFCPFYKHEYDEFDSLGSVDHQSFDNSKNMLAAIMKVDEFKNKTLAEIMYEVIFCKRFIVVIDSDETDNFEEMYQQGFFKETGFEYILYDNWNYDGTTGKSTYNPEFITFEDYYKGRDEEE